MKKVLIVEDEEFIRELYERAFCKAGYDVTLAIDGAEAENKISQQIFDAILLDIMLPKVTGIDVLIEIKKPESKNKNTPVFLITNLGQDEIIKKAFKIGAEGFFLKAHLVPKDIVNEINNFFTLLDNNQVNPVPDPSKS